MLLPGTVLARLNFTTTVLVLRVALASVKYFGTTYYLLQVQVLVPRYRIGKERQNRLYKIWGVNASCRENFEA